MKSFKDLIKNQNLNLNESKDYRNYIVTILKMFNKINNSSEVLGKYTKRYDDVAFKNDAFSEPFWVHFTGPGLFFSNDLRFTGTSDKETTIWEGAIRKGVIFVEFQGKKYTFDIPRNSYAKFFADVFYFFEDKKELRFFINYVDDFKDLKSVIDYILKFLNEIGKNLSLLFNSKELNDFLKASDEVKEIMAYLP